MENQKLISVGKLQKYQSYLNGLQEKVKQGTIGWGEVDATRREHKISSHAFKASLELGYFEKKIHGIYSAKYVGKFEPKHARELIMKEADVYSYYTNKKGKPKESKKIVPIVIDKPKQAVKPEPKPRKKTFSLFWGLFTCSY